MKGMIRSGRKDGATFENWKSGLAWSVRSRVWPNSLNAHRLLAYANAVHFKDTAELNNRLFALTYEQGQNISDVNVLIGVAKEIGLEGAEDVLRTNQFQKEVLAEDGRAKRDLGIECACGCMCHCVEAYPTS